MHRLFHNRNLEIQWCGKPKNKPTIWGLCIPPDDDHNEGDFYWAYHIKTHQSVPYMYIIYVLLTHTHHICMCEQCEHHLNITYVFIVWIHHQFSWLQHVDSCHSWLNPRIGWWLGLYYPGKMGDYHHPLLVLVVSTNPSEKYESVGILFPTQWRVIQNSMVPVTTNQFHWLFRVLTIINHRLTID